MKEDIGDGLSILGFFLMIGMVALGFSGCHAKTEVARIKYEATQ